MQLVNEISQTLNIKPNQVETTLKLFAEDCTVPFISRYRKEATGGLDEVQVQAIKDGSDSIIEREKRREYILKTLKELEKLTPALEKQVKSASSLTLLEDIYAPYKLKRKTKAQLAKEAGHEPVALKILKGSKSIDELAPKADALKGAADIIMEMFAHDVEIKEKLRAHYWDVATISSTKKKKAEEIKDFEKFKDYFEFEQPIKTLKDAKTSHRFLAMRRGMTLKVLKIDVNFDEKITIGLLRDKYFSGSNKNLEFLEEVAKKSNSLYIHTSLDLEVKTELKRLADESAIDVFKRNLRNLLLQPYLGSKTVLGIDPGVRTGCKLAIVDDTGKFIIDTVIYPHEPQRQTKQAIEILNTAIEKFKVAHIAIGNGTFGRETLQFIEKNVGAVVAGACKATLVNEDGASIYSASEIARKEFPDKDLTVRGAISIARRFQDPLAELVKIDPKSIGVGQYQHDVNQVKLKKSLQTVVESCVNFVGVDVNTASAPLLSFISGVGPTVAENIVKFRGKNGKFTTRNQLLKVGRLSQKVFEQAAGFMRIYGGYESLDATFIHPESYEIIYKWLDSKNKTSKDLIEDENLLSELESDNGLKSKIGAMTFKDIISSLKAPSQDPRTEFKSTEFRKDINSIDQLKLDEWYPGIVTNITQFGAFVDIGIKENGLLHVSQIADKFVENALDELSVGQTLKVRVTDVDLSRKRISLSCKTGDGAPVKTSGQNKPENRRSGKNKPRAEQKLRNNAFADLAGFKVKK